jgi:16S rRNA (guanine966-N2)-methyltransferase
MDTRPTSEKVREAIFNILPDVGGIQVLDVFAGSGALGIEALSRGAAHATFIDLGKQALTTVRTNLRDLGLDGRATVLAGDAVALVARHRPAAPWGLVFIDPPYRSDLAIRSAGALAHLAEDAVIVIEYDRRNPPPERIDSLLRTDERRYGDTMVAFYRRETT